jgi:hypothetical protein
MRFSTRVLPLSGSAHGELRRAGVLSPYALELVAEDALRAGRRARIEITIWRRDADTVAWVQQRLARLGRREIDVAVRHADPADGARLTSSQGPAADGWACVVP